MIYVYDVMLNLSKELYDFYDWSTTDDITQFRKIPLVKISEKVYKYFITSNVKVDEEFLNMIKEKGQVYVGRLLKNAGNVVILTNGYDTVAVSFDNDGKSVLKSRLSLSDEVEVIELSNNLKVKSFNYEVLDSSLSKSKLIRKEKRIIDEILNKLNEIKNNSDLVNYLYYEWTGKVYKGKNCFNELIREISHEYNEKSKEFLKVLNIAILKKV